MNQKLLVIISCLLVSIDLFSQANCSAPAQLQICPDTTLLSQSNFLMGNDAPAGINIPGEDLVYQINVPLATRKLYFNLAHLTGGNVRFTVLKDSCNGSLIYGTAISVGASPVFSLNVSGSTKYFLWIDAAATVLYDLSVGADTMVVATSHPNTQGNFMFDSTACATPMFNNLKPFYQVTYNGVFQTNPMTLAPLNVQGTMCISTFLSNLTGDEGVRTFSFVFGTGYTNISAPDTIPGFYNGGKWIRSSFLNSVTYTFYDSLSMGRGDFDGSPNSCLKYEFCFNLTPTSNSPSITDVTVVLTTDGFGAPYSGNVSYGCCASGYPNCHFGNGGSAGGVNAIGFGMNDPGGGNPLPIELVSFTALPEKYRVELSWTTASEINNDYFTIERSINGSDWYLVQRVDGAGNSTALINYQIVDPNPANGISYYRLKQTDYDGIEKVFPAQQVTLDFGGKYSIFPNPVSDYLYVNSVDELGFRVSCYNSIGQKVLANDIIAGQSGILTISDLPDGVYFVSIEQSGLIVKTEAILVRH